MDRKRRRFIRKKNCSVGERRLAPQTRALSPASQNEIFPLGSEVWVVRISLAQRTGFGEGS
jgi:hypothetical protein